MYHNWYYEIPYGFMKNLMQQVSSVSCKTGKFSMFFRSKRYLHWSNLKMEKVSYTADDLGNT